MFEKEAEENGFGIGCTVRPTIAWQKGAEFGYNKANKVHDMMMNPHDTPNDNEEVVVSGRTGLVKAVAVFHRRSDGTFFWASTDELIVEHSESLFKWCRIPTFSEEIKEK